MVIPPLASCYVVCTQYNAGDAAGLIGSREHKCIGKVLGFMPDFAILEQKVCLHTWGVIFGS